MGFNTNRGEAFALGERTPLALVNAPASGRMAVGEALTNIAAARIEKIGDIKLSANWMAAAGHHGTTVGGLKRYRATNGPASRWEKNWLTNHPVQGSAAVVFKAAGNRLDKLYQQYGARIIIPLHDAFIFEAPLGDLEIVADLTARVMCDTLQECFPTLRPQVEVNISNPTCWNKDGDGEELERWIESLNVLMDNHETGNKEA